MPKQVVSDAVKISNLIKSFPGEFSPTPEMELFCLLCQEVVKFNKRHFVERHVKSGKHTKRMSQRSEAPKKQQFLNVKRNDFLVKVLPELLFPQISLCINCTAPICELSFATMAILYRPRVLIEMLFKNWSLQRRMS